MSTLQKTIQNKITGKGFEFDDSINPKTGKQKHDYYLEGRHMTGCTTVLGVIAKPALIPWAVKMAIDSIRENCKMENGVYTVTEEQLETAKKAHAQRLKDAGDIGTKTHAWIESYVRAKIDKTPLPEVEDDIKLMTEQFVAWEKENKITFLDSERKIYSKKYWFAGTVDLIFEKDGKKYVGDIKTSSGIYKDYFMQTAGYQLALEEMGDKDFFGHEIIRCGKDGSFETEPNFDYESNRDGFLSALTLYRLKNNY